MRPKDLKSLLAGLTCLALLLAACGSDNKVGSEELLKFEEKGQGRLGEAAVPSPEATQAQAQAQSSPTSKQVQAVQEQAPDIVVSIIRDSPFFDPPAVKMLAGAKLRVTNKDAQPRSYFSETGEFASGTLAPGESWEWVANVIGKFTVRDDTRPFVVGSFEVVSR